MTKKRYEKQKKRIIWRFGDLEIWGCGLPCCKIGGMNVFVCCGFVDAKRQKPFTRQNGVVITCQTNSSNDRPNHRNQMQLRIVD